MADWRYDIQYGPDGEANFAFVYDAEGALVSNLRTHHAKAVVDAMNHRAPSPDPRPAAQPGVVKGLEWHGPDCDGEYWAGAMGGGYAIRKEGEQGRWLSRVGGYFETVDAAKAAAQADYERRILSQIDFAALADPVSQEPVAWQSKLGPKGEWANDPLGFDPVLRAKSEAAGAQWRPLYASPQPLTEGEPSEAKRLLDTLREESWDLRCFDVPTGGGDADIGWRIVGHWQAQPCERVIAEVYHDDPQAAIRAALLAAKSKGGQADG